MKFGLKRIVIVAGLMQAGCYSAHPMLPQSDLTGLAQLANSRSYRVSSYGTKPDIDSNRDNIPIEPGQTVELANIDGPGMITHIWSTVNAQDPLYPRSLVLRMYWDGDPDPAVESPLGDFFAVGHGALKDVSSTPVQVSSSGRARNCFWPMPFRKSARVTLTNDSPVHRVNLFYYYIDYEKMPELPEDTAYFHAQYRQEYPCQHGDYLILDTEGEGHYVGTVLSMWNTRSGWYGEGDDRFYIDGDETPSLHGTGTEDYFSDAWGFREFNYPDYGVSLLDGFYVGDRTSAYRWHIKDPIRFRKSLRFEIEHKGNMVDHEGERIPFSEHNSHYSSVAFWYQKSKAKRFAEMPPVEQRVPFEIKTEALELLGKGDIKCIAGGEMDTKKPSYAKGKLSVAWFHPKPDADSILVEANFEVPEDKYYLVLVDLLGGPDYGTCSFTLDGEPYDKDAELENSRYKYKGFKAGWPLLKKGKHTLQINYNPGDAGKSLGVKSIRLVPLP
ncbi:glycoside hydrolase family 172 protein [Candidatus Hydrogenedentota bacterium]